MIWNNVELHNVEEVQTVESSSQYRMLRVPESVRECLNDGAKARMLDPAGAEIRFVCRDDAARLTLSCPNGESRVVIFHGLFQSNQEFLLGPEPQDLEIIMPERVRLLESEYVEGMSFSPAVCRIVLGGGAVHIHNIDDTHLRPPTPDELPSLRYLAYGTSITHGFRATGPHLSYAAQTARRIGADLINLGVGGSALCEPDLADYVAGRDDWGLATLGLSVNMVGHGFTPDEFYERVSYMVNTIAASNTNRPVVCITLYPHFRDTGLTGKLPGRHGQLPKAAADEYREMLRKAVENCPNPNAYLLEGPDILEEITGLSIDLLHPADNGMIQMGENLARKLQDILGS